MLVNGQRRVVHGGANGALFGLLSLLLLTHRKDFFTVHDLFVKERHFGRLQVPHDLCGYGVLVFSRLTICNTKKDTTKVIFSNLWTSHNFAIMIRVRAQSQKKKPEISIFFFSALFFGLHLLIAKHLGSLAHKRATVFILNSLNKSSQIVSRFYHFNVNCLNWSLKHLWRWCQIKYEIYICSAKQTETKSKFRIILCY